MTAPVPGLNLTRAPSLSEGSEPAFGAAGVLGPGAGAIDATWRGCWRGRRSATVTADEGDTEGVEGTSASAEAENKSVRATAEVRRRGMKPLLSWRGADCQKKMYFRQADVNLLSASRDAGDARPREPPRSSGTSTSSSWHHHWSNIHTPGRSKPAESDVPNLHRHPFRPFLPRLPFRPFRRHPCRRHPCRRCRRLD